MKTTKLFWELLLKQTLIIGVFLLVIMVTYYHIPNPAINTISLLTGHTPYSDIAQDFYGFRALVLHLDPYPILSKGLLTLDVKWDLPFPSTHPPTAYLLVAPVAFLPYPIASAIWGWLMLLAILISLRQYDISWYWAIILSFFALFWSPGTFSLMQLTPLWLLGLAFAYKNRENPFLAGIWIGFASLTKFLPAILLIPFLLQKKWSVVKGFTLVWVISIGILLALYPAAISRYFEVNQANSLFTISRLDNGALLPIAFRFLNWPGILSGILLLGIIAYFGRRDWFMYEYLAVALLPIAWTYSLLPLLPGTLKNRNNIPVVLAFLFSIIMPAVGNISAIFVAGILLLFGIGQIYRAIFLPHRLANALAG